MHKLKILFTTVTVTALMTAVFLNSLTWTSSAPVDGPAAPGEQEAQLPHVDAPSQPAEPEKPAEPEPLFSGNINRLPPDMIVELLDFLHSPIAGAAIRMTDGQLPGAPRAYRNGTHEGVDYYDGFCGVPIRRGTPVLAAADGVVTRIDHTYIEMTAEQRAEYRRQSAQAPTTPAEILDRFRGRQVWIEHAGKVLTRYAHLDSVNAGISVGDAVAAGQQIGTVGNSGTPPAITGGEGEMHLHFEIWLNGHYLGERLPPQEIRNILQRILE